MKTLMWMNQAEPKTATAYDVVAAKRQHVMLDYLAKREDELPTKPADTIDRSPRRSRRLATLPEHEAPAESRHPTVHRERHSKIAGRKKTSQRRQRMVPKPATPLLNKNDQEIYQAAWFHSSRPAFIGTWSETSWRNKCRIEWNHAFWDFARQDETLLAMFMTFAAAKEAMTRGTDNSRAYFSHKGKALSLVNKDIKQEGQSLRMAAVSAICLLCKAAFVEEDYKSAEQHVSALAALTIGRLETVPSFLWLFIVWADLRLTAVSSRAPVLTHTVHPDYRVQLSENVVSKAAASAEWHATDVPRHGVLSSSTISRLLTKLYEFTAAYNDDLTDYVAAWTVSYEVAYFLAELESNYQDTRCAGGDCDCALTHIVITAARIQFWATASPFVPQDGLQQHLLSVFMAELQHVETEDLYRRWEDNGSADSLLWALFHACAVVIHQNDVGRRPRSGVIDQLCSTMRLVLDRLGIATVAVFEQQLRAWPFAEIWNGSMSRRVYEWIEEGHLSAPRTKHTAEGPLSRCMDFRLTFDPLPEQLVK